MRILLFIFMPLLLSSCEGAFNIEVIDGPSGGSSGRPYGPYVGPGRLDFLTDVRSKLTPEREDEAIERLSKAFYEGNIDFDGTGSDLLVEAAEKGLVRFGEEAIKLGAKIDATNFLGKTAAHIAVEESRITFLEMLIKRKANLNIQDTITRRSPLGVAVDMKGSDKDKIKIIRLLLNAGAQCRRAFGRRAIDKSVIRKIYDLGAKDLVKKALATADLSEKDFVGKNFFHVLAEINDYEIFQEAVKWLPDNKYEKLAILNDKTSFSPPFGGKEPLCFAKKSSAIEADLKKLGARCTFTQSSSGASGSSSSSSGKGTGGGGGANWDWGGFFGGGGFSQPIKMPADCFGEFAPAYHTQHKTTLSDDVKRANANQNNRETLEEIKKRVAQTYRKLSLANHPDKCPSEKCAEVFKRVNICNEAVSKNGVGDLLNKLQ